MWEADCTWGMPEVTRAGVSRRPRPRFSDMTKAVALQVVMLSGTVTVHSKLLASLGGGHRVPGLILGAMVATRPLWV